MDEVGNELSSNSDAMLDRHSVMITSFKMSFALLTSFFGPFRPAANPSKCVQPTRGLGSRPGQIPVSLGEQFQHLGMVIEANACECVTAQRSDRDGAGVIRVVLLCPT